MEIKTIVDGASATFEVEGKLTVQTAPDLEAAIDAAPADASNLAIDLTKVDYVSSAGLRVFVATQKLALKRGGSFQLLHPRDEVMEVLEMTGLSEVLDVER